MSKCPPYTFCMLHLHALSSDINTMAANFHSFINFSFFLTKDDFELSEMNFYIIQVIFFTSLLGSIVLAVLLFFGMFLEDALLTTCQSCSITC